MLFVLLDLFHFCFLATSIVTSSQAVVWVTHMYYEKALKEIDSKHWTLFLNGIFKQLPYGRSRALFARMLFYAWHSLRARAHLDEFFAVL